MQDRHKGSEPDVAGRVLEVDLTIKGFGEFWSFQVHTQRFSEKNPLNLNLKPHKGGFCGEVSFVGSRCDACFEVLWLEGHRIKG